MEGFRPRQSGKETGTTPEFRQSGHEFTARSEDQIPQESKRNKLRIILCSGFRAYRERSCVLMRSRCRPLRNRPFDRIISGHLNYAGARHRIAIPQGKIYTIILRGNYVKFEHSNPDVNRQVVLSINDGPQRCRTTWPQSPKWCAVFANSLNP